MVHSLFIALWFPTLALSKSGAVEAKKLPLSRLSGGSRILFRILKSLLHDKGKKEAGNFFHTRLCPTCGNLNELKCCHKDFVRSFLMEKMVLVISFICVILSTVIHASDTAIEFKKADDLYLEVLEAVE